MKCNVTKKGVDEDEECFEGFAYDLVAEMARFNKFKFKFTTHEDYGTPNHKTGKWNGMIGELQSMVSNSNYYVYIYSIARLYFNSSLLHRRYLSIFLGKSNL